MTPWSRQLAAWIALGVVLVLFVISAFIGGMFRALWLPAFLAFVGIAVVALIANWHDRTPGA